MSQRKNDRSRIEDVAKAAGVSIMTISRAMRGVEGVSQKKREEILRIADRLGYSPNKIAVSLAASSSNLIGVSVPTLFGTVFSEIYDGMRPAFEKAGFAIMIYVTDYSLESEEEWVERMIAWRPAGLILSGVDHSQLTLERLANAKIPVLEIWDFNENPIDLCVGIDHVQSGVSMGQHLVQLGYTRPAYVGLIRGKDTRSEGRLTGLTQVFMDNGIHIAHIERSSPTSSFENGFIATERLLSNVQAPPDVICYLNDNMAFGGLMACERFGLRCPEDIGIVGYNGLNINTVLHKRITTTLTPRLEIGETGARLLIAKILGAITENAIEMPVKIDTGKTTIPQNKD